MMIVPTTVQPEPIVYVTTTVPEAWPVSKPVTRLIVASDDGPVIQVPPVVASLSITLLPWHTIAGPSMGGGGGSTVMSFVVVQPVPKEYVIVAKPGPAAYTVPVELTVATPVLLLPHVPPVVRSVSIVLEPRQILAAPVMSNGGVFTVNTTDDEQPVPSVYTTVVVPGVTPQIVPPELIVATPVLVLNHEPPGEPSVRVMHEPTHS